MSRRKLPPDEVVLAAYCKLRSAGRAGRAFGVGESATSRLLRRLLPPGARTIREHLPPEARAWRRPGGKGLPLAACGRCGKVKPVCRSGLCMACTMRKQ